jgi:Flp pilus assembly pilin Flp
MVKRWLREESGVTSIERALIAALIALVIVGAQGVGVELKASMITCPASE